MNATKAKSIHSLLTVTKTERIGKGITNPHYGTVGCVVKQDGPRGIIAEYLCYVIGQFMGLPVAPGFIAMVPNEYDEVAPHYVVMRVGTDCLPPMRKETVIHKFPREAAGLGVFDVLNGNSDRHEGNMAYVEHPDGGESMFIFDHGYTLEYITNESQRVPFVDARNREFVPEWIAKAQTLPYAVLENAINYLRTFDWRWGNSTRVDFDELLANLWHRVQNLHTICKWDTESDHIICDPSYRWGDAYVPDVQCHCKDCDPDAQAAKAAEVRADPLYAALAAAPVARVAEFRCSITNCPLC